jgi:siroheme synthase-like protein
MLVDLALTGKKTLVIGKGEEVRIRATQLAAEGAKVAILSDEDTRHSNDIGKASGFEFLRDDFDRWKSVLQKIRPFVVVVSTGELRRDEKIATYARGVSNLVYVVDRPKLNDINMAGIAKLGDVRVAVSTQGLSPAMAGILRRKIESVITAEDILLVKLQGEVRSYLKSAVDDPAYRRKIVYRLVRDKIILSLLGSKKYDEAKERALEVISRNSKKLREN